MPFLLAIIVLGWLPAALCFVIIVRRSSKLDREVFSPRQVPNVTLSVGAREDPVSPQYLQLRSLPRLKYL